MTASTTDDRMAELNARFTPQRVDLSLHGGSVTITFLLDGRYYTAERIRPDFPAVPDDAKLVFAGSIYSPGGDRLDDRRLEVENTGVSRRYFLPEERCELKLILDLLRKRDQTFGPAFQAYLISCRLDDVEPTNRSYYEALKVFTTVWLRLEKIITGK